MSTPNSDAGGPGAAFSAIRLLERACDRFEAAWRAEQSPRIDDYLDGFEGDRAGLLRELIGIEVAYRRARGESPGASEYERRFPDDPLPIRAILGQPGLGPGARVSSSSRVGEYEILDEIGRGGMGVVYRARQGGLNRVVALKTILATDRHSPEAADRLRVEAEAIARLRDPRIVQIHAIGEHDGHPYLAMEYIEGGSLADRLDGVPLAPAQAARLVAALAEAIEHAHRVGVVHRDLKPSNILIDGEGRPKITDFGLAKCLDADHRLTRTDSVLGSPGYMAPEQADGRAVAVGPAADVYSLGAIFYELLTGRPPFRAESVLATLDLVRTSEAVPPSRLVPATPRDAETICLTCLSKEPPRRYATAAALAADLRRFAAGEPIAARAVGPFERSWLWARRRPASAALVGVTAAAIGLLAVLVPVAALALARLDDLAGSRQAPASVTPRAARLPAGKPDSGTTSSDAISPRPDLTPENFAFEIPPPSARTARPPVVLGAHGDQVWDGVFSADGSLVATASWDGTARIWGRDDGIERARLDGRAGRLSSVAFSPDATRLAAGGADGTVVVWDLGTGRIAHRLRGHTDKVRCVAFSPDGSLIASGSWDGSLRVWESGSGRPYRTLATGARCITRLAFSPDGRRVALGGTSRVAEVWNLVDARLMTTFRGHSAHVLSVSFSPDGRLIASTSGDPDGKTGGNFLWETTTGRETLRFDDPATVLERVEFSPDGTILATGGWDGAVRLFGAGDGRELAVLRGHADRVWGVAWDRAGEAIVSSSADRSARIWDRPDLTIDRAHGR